MPAPPTPEIRDPELAARAGKMLMAVLRRSHLAGAHELGAILAQEARTVGVERLVVLLADYEQALLVPVPAGDGEDREPLAIGGTLAGRCFATTEAVDAPADGGRRLWLPLLDGTDRLGVVELTLPGAPGDPTDDLAVVCARYAHLIATLVVAKDAYSDVFKRLRRRRPPTVATELVREQIPPRVLATDDFVLAAIVEPAYDIGGDAYDYALNGDVLHAAIFDAVGHGIEAAGAATYALSVYRHRRRAGDDLTATHVAIDVELDAQFGASRYVTGCLAELDVRRGSLRWVNAGHPPPLLLRRGRFVKELEVERRTPLGVRMGASEPVVGQASLEDGDMVLLYTDGLTEARRPDGRLFTTRLLAQFIEREAASGHAAPETLRRLRHAIIERPAGTLHDDATAVLVEWRRGSARALLPHPADNRW